ncbi:MAG: threonine/serine exporter family protein [Clostridium sp.]|uniref:threonine/serine exporter family protein n=1 Tax=Clostridium sp. DSM 8431 TaxID=1761781 RepID=UPI0008DF4696|nr:threonine/serine exporter family protein [Clostridium sp. DSM 8431]MCR4943644.1 threonine/serine exporter family protein [Clostridium sp.]SFU49228.1 Uncharacterized membrane protein YjjP, DUF1212 family [Clostridium sp. DSM 8431]
MDMDRLLQVSSYAGQIMLQNGAETYRVEETICRICLSFGAEKADSFVTPTGIIVSIYKNDKTYSILKRVTSRGVDLNKIDKVNTLSRLSEKKHVSIESLYNSLKEIDQNDRYSTLTTLIFSAISAGCFAFLFKGTVKDVISASIIGFIIQYVSILLSRISVNSFFINSICGAIASALSVALYSLNIASQVDKTNIGAIMLLVPGLAITNAARDIIAADYLSGLTKAAEAFLIAVAIATGAGAVLSFYINILGGKL